MIQSKHRFHGRSSLRFVYQHGQTVRGQLISLRYVLNNRQSAYRVAVVVSRKVSKSAVRRNRIRRRLYEIIRNLAPAITKPYDLVFTVYGEEMSLIPAAELRKNVLAQLKKANILALPDIKHGILNNVEISSKAGVNSSIRQERSAREKEILFGSAPPSEHKETNNNG